MYSLETPLETVKGIGPKLSEKLSEQGFLKLKDLLLFLPLRYSDRSEIVKISELEQDKLITFRAKLKSISGFYKNRRRMDTAVVEDETGKIKLMWFNNKFISKSLIKGESYMISGKLNDRGTITQPTVELDKADTIHTGRLVPLYSSTIDIQQGSLRRILRHITTQLESYPRNEFNKFSKEIVDALIQLHFPNSEELVIQARERLALEELLSLIKTSEIIKEHWKNLKSAEAITLSKPQIPESIPFKLTNAQKRSVKEILSDIQLFTPMNRVLIGDVGSGKTVVAGIAAQQVLKCGHSVALVAPTKILAAQHYETLQQLFPTLELVLLAGKSKFFEDNNDSKNTPKYTPKLYIGTHAVINKLDKIKPGLIIYDEQHRFGVKQRSTGSQKNTDNLAKRIVTPHTLTMSATPIPRSLMLTIFSHLKVSFLDEMPAGRKTTKTWIVSEEKREASYDWIKKELMSKSAIPAKLTKSTKLAKPTKLTKPTKLSRLADNSKLALIICPFIDPSNHQAFENVASTKETFEEIKKYFTNNKATTSNTTKRKLEIGLLHGRMKKDEQDKVIDKLYDNKIDILVTTPIVEVGVDLPAASIIVIESADRFGMASLHQLRGRVGRAGQQGYCLLFSESKSTLAKKRLKQFSQENNGLKLAELDLQNRGSGDIFGTTQSGFSQLRFATWTNLELIAKAKQAYQELPKDWVPFFDISNKTNETKPLAN